MNFCSRPLLISLIFLLSVQCAYANETPQALAAKLTGAMKAKDIDAASKLVEWNQAPIAAHRMFKMSVADCFTAKGCKVEVVSISEEEKQPQSDYHYLIVPEGKLKIVEPDGSEGLSMPFAKIGNEYKIILGQQTNEAYAQAKAATDAHKIAKEVDADLVASGQPLPADGGEPLPAYLTYVDAITRGDTSFLAQHGTSSERYFFGTAYRDNAPKAAIALELARMESIAKPTIKGGFIKENKAILLVSGTNGQGWTSEGAVLLLLDSGKWSTEDKLFLSYPPQQP